MNRWIAPSAATNLLMDRWTEPESDWSRILYKFYALIWKYFEHLEFKDIARRKSVTIWILHRLFFKTTNFYSAFFFSSPFPWVEEWRLCFINEWGVPCKRKTDDEKRMLNSVTLNATRVKQESYMRISIIYIKTFLTGACTYSIKQQCFITHFITLRSDAIRQNSVLSNSELSSFRLMKSWRWHVALFLSVKE